VTDEWIWNTGGVILTGKSEVLRDKPVTVSLCPPQIPHGPIESEPPGREFQHKQLEPWNGLHVIPTVKSISCIREEFFMNSRGKNIRYIITICQFCIHPYVWKPSVSSHNSYQRKCIANGTGTRKKHAWALGGGERRISRELLADWECMGSLWKTAWKWEIRSHLAVTPGFV
jgi:hypothetical protein